MNRRQILLGGMGAGLLATGLLPLWRPALADDAAPAAAAADGAPDGPDGYYSNERSLGDRNAKAVLIEYASLSCPHCAAFNEQFVPQLRKDWIDQGKLFYVYRDFPLNAPALWAAMVANCLEGERYFAFIDLLFKNQATWLTAKEVAPALFTYAQLAGMDQARFDQCANDEAELNRILARVEYAQKTYDITGTPTLILNGDKVQPTSYQELSDLIAAKQ